MKKFLTSTLLTIAILSFGGISVLAHAQTVSADDQATLQQQLQLMKDKLQLLQLQQTQEAAQAVAPADSMTVVTGEPTVTVTVTAPTEAQASANISSGDAAALNAALATLASTLVNLQTAIQNDPQFLAQNGPVIAQSLSGIESSLSAVLVSMQSGPSMAYETYTQTLAQRTPSAPVAVKSRNAPAAATDNSLTLNQGSLLPSVNSAAQNQNVNSGGADVTASALSGKSRLPAIIVGIILLAMIAILVWGRSGEELATATAKSGPKKSPAPAPLAPIHPSVSFVSNQPSGSSTPSASPLASAMGNQSQRKNA